MTNYDEDYNDPGQRCVHGTFVGSWWGPDYLCGWCEDGISVEEMHRILADQAARAKARAEERYNTMLDLLNLSPYDVRVAQALTEYVWVIAF